MCVMVRMDAGCRQELGATRRESRKGRTSLCLGLSAFQYGAFKNGVLLRHTLVHCS